MKSLQWLVILSAWTCLGVSDGIRVPSAWEDAQRRDGFGSYNGGVNSNLGFGNGNGQQRYNDGRFQRRVFVDNGQANAELGTLYNTLQSNALNDFFGHPNQMMVLGQNGLYMLPQNNQESAAIPSKSNQYRTELPPLNHPRYPQNAQLQNNNNVQYDRSSNHPPNAPFIGRNQYQNPQNPPIRSIQNEAYEKYETLPSNVLRITPTSSGNINLNNYKLMEQPKSTQSNLKQFPQKYKPSIHKEYAQTPSMSYGTQLKVPAESLKNHVSQDHRFIVSASTVNPIESDSDQRNQSDEFTTKKEPIFFVTEGYRNVLIQGPNKKKKYQRPQYQNQEESKKVLNTEKLEQAEKRDDAGEEDEKPPRKRKVTKIYKIHGNNQDEENSAGGSNRNLVGSGWEKPRQYFNRPQGHTDDDRRSGLTNQLITNYRDDKLHEPSDDHDREREEDDNEEIKDDENDNTKKLESEDENETEDVDDLDNENTPKAENNNTDTGESEDDEEADDEESENEEEEEPEQEVPHSEHADPKPVPTRPNYPGERVWAKPGVKHRPYVSKHSFIKPQEIEQKPDGYDVFEDLEKYFENQKDQFGRSFGAKIPQPVQPGPNAQVLSQIPSIKSPNSVNPIVVYDPFRESSERSLQQVPSQAIFSNKQRTDDGVAENSNPETAEKQPESNDENYTEEVENDVEEGSNDKEDFVPLQLYTQVRKSENEEHEPYDPLEHGRLREIIKDSKVQTVYSEEGYEDAAYDHAGHEKKAEKDQGHEEFEREKQEKDSDAGHSNKVLISDEPIEDSLPADSIYPSLLQENIMENKETILNKKPKPSNNKNFITTKEVKTTQVKDKINGDVQLEIQSEVKVIVQPNNSTKSHKYVKIYPKVLREYSKELPKESKQKQNEETEDTIPYFTTTENNKHNESSDTENINLHKKIEKITLTSAKPINDATSTESASAAKVSVKAFKNEFENSVSSEKPKVVVKVLDDEEALTKINDQFGKIGSKIHRKRRSIDGDNKDLEIDIGFIDRINHTFAAKKPDVIDVEKYPYYAMPDLNENSPLRYAENMENIPVKKVGELSFYKMADKYQCPDLPQNIDPIPEHVKNAKQNESDDEGEEDEDEEDEEEGNEEENEDESNVDQEHPPTPKTPRIQLGDKIDCLKIRYFGENPLDSPFFKEETVGPVKSIFKELEQKSAKLQNYKNIDNPQETSQKVQNINKVNEIFNQNDKKDERKFENEVKDKVYNALKETVHKFSVTNSETNPLSSIKENDNAESINRNVKVTKPIDSEKLSEHTIPTPSPLVTLITTPKYTIQLTPKNIYDQIRLLDHLPEEEDVTELIETSTKNIELTAFKKQAKVRQEVSTKAAVQNRIDRIDGREESSRREPKILREENNREGQIEGTPDAEALRRRKLRRRKPIFQIFDVNKFLPTTPFPIISNVHSTVLPKHKVLSEVFYKDEIKPNEQLNVFADVLNNIKNSTNFETVPLQSASNFAEPGSVTISNLEEIQMSPNIRVKKYQKDSSNSQNLLDRNPLQDLLTTEKQFNAHNPESYKEHQSSTNKNIVNLGFNNPDNFGYIDQNRRNKQKSPNSDEDTNQYHFHPTTKVSTKKYVRRRRKPTKGPTATSTTFRTTTNINIPNQSTPSNHKPYVIDVIEDTKGVIGLVPPTKWLYKTIVEDSDAKGTDEAPEEVYEYKTIPPNYATETITGAAAVTELTEEEPPARPMNTYYFLGLKPPLNQRARSYMEFMGNKNLVNNNVKRRTANVGYGHLRLKREAARTRYSDVSRNRGSQNENIEKEITPVDDIDDYVPHRPKNYHYDEKTGKIVYHNKPTEEKKIEDEEEEEYEEIQERPGIYLETAEDATHPPAKKVTTKPLLATATPPPAGQGLLDFVAKLKNNPSYKLIPDPTTPDPSIKTSTQEIVTVDPKSTNPPEFLSILSKVKSDSSYKFIEDPKESKSISTRKTTTPEPEYDEQEDEEEDEEEGSTPHRRVTRQTDLLIFNVGDYLPKIQTPISSPIPKTPNNFFKKQIVEKIFPKLRYMTPLDIAKEKIRERFENNTIYQFIQKNIQNSPGGQSQQLSNIEIFDIGDYLPKIKNISPKTSIDYSKYKTIDRPHSRHNMSSKYNSDEQEEVINVRRPVIMEERESIDRPVVSEERIAHDKEAKVVTEEVASSTTQKIVQFRRGTRPTTQKTTAETAEPTESLATRRTANRRRPLPSGFRTTKRPTTAEVTAATEKVARVYPQNSQSDRTYSQTHEPAKRVYRRRPVRIRHTTERHEEDDESVDTIMRRSLDFEDDDVRDEFEKEFLEEQNIPKTYENVKQDILNVDPDDDIANDNITEKESGATDDNEEYVANEDAEENLNIKSNTEEADEVLTDNREEKEASESNKREIVAKIKKNIDVINNENVETENGKVVKDKEVKDETKKPSEIVDNQKEATQNGNKKNDVEIVNQYFDRTQRHGGNYRRENGSEDSEDVEELNKDDQINKKQVKEVANHKSDVEIVDENFDKTKKHGGNYKVEEDVTAEESADFVGADIQPIKSTRHTKSKNVQINDSKEVTKKKKRRIRPNSTKSNNPKTIPRLTDVVPKPDHFYTDTQLPKEVNTLKNARSEVALDSKELEQVTEEGDVIDVEKIPKRQTTGNRRNDNINKENTNKGSSKDKNEDIVNGYDESDEKVVPIVEPLFIKDPSKRLYFYAPL